jgi:hypothetical protein
MADDKIMSSEKPENWDEYSRLLRGLPEKNVPAGFEARFDARMKAAPGRKSRAAFIWRAVVPAFSIAAILMVIVLGSLPDAPPAPRPAVVSNPAAPEKTTRRPRPNRTSRMRNEPVVPSTSGPAFIDTSTPATIKGAEPTTPIDRRTPTHTSEPVVTGGK